MTPDHPAWPQFVDELTRAVRLRVLDNGAIGWTCSHELDHAPRICRELGLDDQAVELSVAYWHARRGYCDCEILLNVAGDEDGTG
jgi:hypothetical protein